MVEIVIKKDNREEPFDIQKLKNSIIAASQAAGLEAVKQEEIANNVINKILGELSQQEKVTSLELREKVLGELSLLVPSAAQAWTNYEGQK
ncbi:MAG: ATP cone domain-containing protein [Candidatus Pacebacteria bacterium]|nr:ATP cone domain-containing protein [Candidatus Paceibacterota bacterium]